MNGKSSRFSEEWFPPAKVNIHVKQSEEKFGTGGWILNGWLVMSKPREAINVMSIKRLTPLRSSWASKSIDDGVIENDDVDVSLVCRRIRGYRYRPAMTMTGNKRKKLAKWVIHDSSCNFNFNFEFTQTQIFKFNRVVERMSAWKLSLKKNLLFEIFKGSVDEEWSGAFLLEIVHLMVCEIPTLQSNHSY